MSSDHFSVCKTAFVGVWLGLIMARSWLKAGRGDAQWLPLVFEEIPPRSAASTHSAYLLTCRYPRQHRIPLGPFTFQSVPCDNNGMRIRVITLFRTLLKPRKVSTQRKPRGGKARV